jgi:hypothetical protein
MTVLRKNVATGEGCSSVWPKHIEISEKKVPCRIYIFRRTEMVTLLRKHFQKEKKRVTVLKKNVSTEECGGSKPQVCSERRRECINYEKYSDRPRWWLCFINTFRNKNKWLHFTNMCDMWWKQLYFIYSESLKALRRKRLQNIRLFVLLYLPYCHYVVNREPVDGFSSALTWEGFSAIFWSVPVLITTDTLPVNSHPLNK